MALHNLVSFGAEMVPASVSYTIIRKHADQGLFMGAADDDVQWRILSGKSRYAEHLPFLSRSAAIFRVSLNYTSLFPASSHKSKSKHNFCWFKCFLTLDFLHAPFSFIAYHL